MHANTSICTINYNKFIVNYSFYKILAALIKVFIMFKQLKELVGEIFDQAMESKNISENLSVAWVSSTELHYSFIYLHYIFVVVVVVVYLMSTLSPLQVEEIL